jgi:serine/threonine-protein kinase HipA
LRIARVLVHSERAGLLTEVERNRRFRFEYAGGYSGPHASLTMPVREEPYEFNGFPPFFDGLLPEGVQLDGLLRFSKIDKDDCFAQLVAVGGDLVGAVTVTILADQASE